MGGGGPGVTITVIGRGVEIIVLEVVQYSHERRLYWCRCHPELGLFSPILLEHAKKSSYLREKGLTGVEKG